MEEELVNLEKRLNESDNWQGNVWKILEKWEKDFGIFIERNKSKYAWCNDEFENIQALNDPKDFIRGRTDNYKKLFEKIHERA